MVDLEYRHVSWQFQTQTIFPAVKEVLMLAS
jgi:hypothetical protein